MNGSISYVRNKVTRKNGVKALLEGREHLVFPVVMITVGVHNGSSGPVFYPADELEASALYWNGQPILVNHPSNLSGAANPDVLNKQKIGVVFNTTFDGFRLKADAWIDVSRGNAMVANMNSQRKMEVSTGLFAGYERTEGTYNGKPYTFIARNIRPDHLAVLPNQKGACSIEDGCGLLCHCNQASIPMFKPEYCKELGYTPMFTPGSAGSPVPILQNAEPEQPLTRLAMNFDKSNKSAPMFQVPTGEQPLVRRPMW